MSSTVDNREYAGVGHSEYHIRFTVEVCKEHGRGLPPQPGLTECLGIACDLSCQREAVGTLLGPAWYGRLTVKGEGKRVA